MFASGACFCGPVRWARVNFVEAVDDHMQSLWGKAKRL